MSSKRGVISLVSLLFLLSSISKLLLIKMMIMIMKMIMIIIFIITDVKLFVSDSIKEVAYNSYNCRINK